MNNVKIKEAVVFMGRCYVPTYRGVRRASATPEEMAQMKIVYVLRPLGYSQKKLKRKPSRNRKSSFRGKAKVGKNYTYAEQQRRSSKTLMDKV